MLRVFSFGVMLVWLGTTGAPAQTGARKAPARKTAARKKQTTKKRPAGRPAPYDTAAVNNPGSAKALAPKDEGPAALRAQILLDRAHFSVGEIDGRIGENTERALGGFRASRGIPAGTGVGDAVWKALNQDNEAALIPYTISAEDVKGPFVRVPVDMMAKAKLEHLGYSSPGEELGERFHASPALLRRLNPGKTFATVGQQVLVPNVRTQRTEKAAKVVVSKSDSTVTAYDEAGKILAQYPATTGSEHDPLPIGEWKINGVSRNPKFHYNPDLFWDAKPDQDKATIAAGPRNPVGVVWIDLSKEHYGIHGTPEPARIGYSQSHGCIRLTNWDALELAGMVKPGTPAILLEGTALSGASGTGGGAALNAPPAAPLPGQPSLGPPLRDLRASDLRDTFAETRDGVRTHEAMDLLAPRGTPVLAVDDGTIRKLFLSKPGGNTIYEFDLAERFCYYYAHLDHYATGIVEGMKVRRGQVIAYVGTTGNAPPNAPHLHFAINVLGSDKSWWKGTAIDPYPMLLAAAR